MNIHLTLYLNLKKYSPKGFRNGEGLLKIEKEATVQSLLDYLDIPLEEEVTIIVNNRVVRKDMQLRGGEQILILPPISGG